MFITTKTSIGKRKAFARSVFKSFVRNVKISFVINALMEKAVRIVKMAKSAKPVSLNLIAQADSVLWIKTVKRKKIAVNLRLKES